MVAFTYRMPAGIPGVVNRIQSATIETQIIDAAAPPGAYGVPVTIVAGKIQPVGTGDAAAAVYGFNVRPFPTQGNGVDGLGVSTPPVSGITDILKRGYLSVKLNGTTAAAKNGAVYIRVAAAATGKPIGGLEAAADSTNTIAVANAYFTGPADAGGITEIAFNI